MKKIITTFLIITCISIEMIGQTIFVGEKKYSSTPTWIFHMNGENWDSDIEVLIAKTDFGGYLWIAVTYPEGDNFYIGGDLTIFLDNEETIRCVFTNIRDNVDNKAITLYKLTKTEIETLKIKRIMTLRFQVLGNVFYGKRTADNVKKTHLNKTDNSYATEADVTNLFE